MLDAQVQRGFAFVEEKCMEELLTSRGKAIPEGDEEDNSWKTELTMACLAAINPDMTDTEAAACIARGFVEEHPDCYATLQVGEEQLEDGIDNGVPCGDKARYDRHRGGCLHRARFRR